MAHALDAEGKLDQLIHKQDEAVLSELVYLEQVWDPRHSRSTPSNRSWTTFLINLVENHFGSSWRWGSFLPGASKTWPSGGSSPSATQNASHV